VVRGVHPDHVADEAGERRAKRAPPQVNWGALCDEVPEDKPHLPPPQFVRGCGRWCCRAGVV
jgi:hypothetical protein